MTDADLGPWITTHSGKRIYPLHMGMNVYDINDIAHQLSHNNRYNGCLDEPLSVAQHSIHVCQQALKWFDDCDVMEGEEYASDAWMARRAVLGLQALLHDSSEAYLPDFPTPWKVVLGDVAQYDDLLRESIFSAFDLPSGALPKAIKDIDVRIRSDEVRCLHHGQVLWSVTDMEGCGIDIVPMPWHYAKWLFLETFNTLEAQRYV